MRVLLVEDSKDIASFVMKGLKAERFAVDWTAKSEQALLWAKVNAYDIAIMDIDLGNGRTGLEICKAIRDKEKDFPIIMLSVTHDIATKVKALNLGADDYLTKPFSFAELIARVRALLRREKQIVGPIFQIADLVLDVNAHSVIRNKMRIRLNRKEFALLEYFMKNPEVTLTRDMILENVWEATSTTASLTNTVDVHIRFLRRKIDDRHKKKLIHTVHGHGYRLESGDKKIEK